jgi:cell division protein FtsL
MFALAPLFGVVACDTYLNTESLRNDYKIADLSKTLKEHKEELESLKIQEATLQAQNRIEMEAQNLGLLAPEPNQIRVIQTSTPLDENPLRNQRNGVDSLDDEGSFGSEMERLIKEYVLEKRGEGKACQTNSTSSPESSFPAGNLLRKMISSAYAYCVGRS